MDSIEMLPVWAILLLPLLSAFIIALFFQRFDRGAAIVGMGSITLCFLLTLSLPLWTVPGDAAGPAAAGDQVAWHLDADGSRSGDVYIYRQGSELGSGIRAQVSEFVWAGIPRSTDAQGDVIPLGAPDKVGPGGLRITFGVMMDNLAYGMLLIVTSIALLVHIFSIGYLAHEGAWARYFAGLSLFCFSMIGIVLSPNYFQTFIFWELVGVSSYVLIGHYYSENNPPEAAKKAFMTNRVADFFFMMGILGLFSATGSVDFARLDGALDAMAANPGPFSATMVGVLLFFGCMGKSAQFPFHIWLPDAMAGPTPVSALMHAATMVAAGVYLVLRSYPVYDPQALQFIAWVGGVTAFLAATIAIVQNDIKKVLAYSTLSQLGYMMMVLGLGGFAAHAFEHTHAATNLSQAEYELLFRSQCYTVGFFHLGTHAFFKALLFLASGAVIVGMHHHQDMREMGGLFWKMPWTAVSYAVGALALVGMPPFAGFWSKDMILHLAHEANPMLHKIALITAFMTAFYMGRAWIMTFMGTPNSDHAEEAHDVGPSMLFPLYVLVVASIVAGMVGTWGAPMLAVGGHQNTIADLINLGVAWDPASFITGKAAVMSLAIVLISGGAAVSIYVIGMPSPDMLHERFGAIHALLTNKYYCDEIAEFLVTKVQDTGARILDLIEQQIIIGIGVYGFASLWRKAGGVLRYYQSGNVRDYATLLLAGTLVILYAVTHSTTLIGG